MTYFFQHLLQQKLPGTLPIDFQRSRRSHCVMVVVIASNLYIDSGGQHDTVCGNDNLLFNSTDLVESPGPSRFANAGRPARTGMSSSPGQPGLATVYSGQAPVVAATSRHSPVCRRWFPGESRQRPGRASVYRNTAGTHRVYTGIRPRQSCGNAPVSPRSSPVMPRRSPGECRWHSGRAPGFWVGAWGIVLFGWWGIVFFGWSPLWYSGKFCIVKL
ncbi:hypothetical protein DPMN_061292 [Dreissena polymorpha]|uniref:Uncharacterized protein n=1 Tax=Dreissena polymorpha TaxID=45954 RepID=A0A9D4HIB6_DREPO|nr:hypothetical protein DPMN_061292 [Dreissena polymorpha]